MPAQEEPEALRMEASFSGEQAQPGEVITLKLSFELPKGAVLPEKPSIKGLEELTVLSTKVVSGGIIAELIVDTLGTLYVPALTLAFTDADGKERLIITDPVQLTVTPSIESRADALHVRPIKGIMPVYGGLWRRWLPYFLVALTVLLVFGVWRAVIRRRRKEEQPVYSEPPDGVALKALDNLDRAGLFEKGEVKAYYFSLSEIVRRYMEGIRPFPACEWTTDEIAASVDRDEDRVVLKLLRESDMVKFADHSPTMAQKKEHWLQARQYVENTIRELKE